MKLTLMKNSSDGILWRCNNYRCSKTSMSIRSNSWLSNYKIDIKQVIKAIFLWSTGSGFSLIKCQVRMSAPVFIRLRYFLIEKIKSYYEAIPIRLGGHGVIVQCDEVKLNYNVKSHRGRGPRDQIWGLSIVDTSTSPAQGFCQIIKDKKAETMIPIISSVVHSGSIIHTDEHKSYVKLGLQYTHRSVIHKYHFIAPETGVHTQQVESYHNKIKMRMKMMRGVDDDKKMTFS